MRIQEIRTEHSPADVIARAHSFFMLAGTSYAAFPEESSGTYLKLFLEVGEITIGVVPWEGGSLVRASASRGGPLLNRFMTTLSSPNEVRETLHRYRLHRPHGAFTEDFRPALRAGEAALEEADGADTA